MKYKEYKPPFIDGKYLCACGKKYDQAIFTWYCSRHNH